MCFTVSKRSLIQSEDKIRLQPSHAPILLLNQALTINGLDLHCPVGVLNKLTLPNLPNHLHFDFLHKVLLFLFICFVVIAVQHLCVLGGEFAREQFGDRGG